MNRHRFPALSFVLVLSCLASAQVGGSTAGAARTRYLGAKGLLPAAKDVVVEDIVNYHKHDIGQPKAGEAVNLDLRWDRDRVANGRPAVMQVGLSTAFTSDRSHMRPLNLSLVIDKSGSMAADDKLVRVKQALQTFVSHLRETDVVSIVVFDSGTKVLVPAQRVGDRRTIREAIQGIEPGSSTNINAGLMLGYQEALKNYRKEFTNRVILLTDGIANQGVVDPQEIASGSLSNNDRGIDLSTIGVGQDLNQDLLSKLAKSGRGLYHFVADAGDIDKVFAKEAQSLISPVASEPNLQIEFDPRLKLDKIYGYDPKVGKNSVGIKLDNMNNGLTEVVLLRFKPSSDGGEFPVKVRLSYYDVLLKKHVVKTEVSSIAVASESANAPSSDSSVAKNYAIANLAQAMRDMAAAYEAKRYYEAESLLKAAVSSTRHEYPNAEDEDIKRTLTTAEKYLETLRQHNAAFEESLPSILPNGDFSLGNVGFVSDLPYLAPGENVLWGGSYTIAPRFDSPQLHRLIAPEPFAPLPRTGRDRAFYANAGGTESLVILSTNVRCEPNTKYLVRFRAISLTRGREWVPTFEIRVNGERSEPQPAGDGFYTEVKAEWNSGKSRTATVSIVRMPIPHGGGLIGISNFEMIPVSR